MEQKLDNIWIGQKDLANDKEFLSEVQSEFTGDISADLSQSTETLSGNRRDFLKFLGFGLGAATVAAGCDIPVKKAIPYVVKPDSIVPGIANYYASSYVEGGDYCSILVKTREGRPIKIEGNDLSDVTGGGTSARVQASVLSLYDVNRLKGPLVKKDNAWMDSSWAEIDKLMLTTLPASSNIRIVTNTILSPTTHAAIAEFSAKYSGMKTVTYDPVCSGAILEAHQKQFGKAIIPGYEFANADIIVSFNADFLGTWISPIEFAKAYASRRVIKDANNPKMSRHYQVEAHMSMTGSNADNRILVKPSEQGVAIAHLYNILTGSNVPTTGLNDKAKKALNNVASELKKAAGKSLVISGSTMVSEQMMINAINQSLGNYESTVSTSNYSLQRQGNLKEIFALLEEMKSGSIDLIIFNNCNPIYDTPFGKELTEGLNKVKNKVSFSGVLTETAQLCDIIGPCPHFLESWGDAQPKAGSLSLIQPTIAPLFDTRNIELSFLKWSESSFLQEDTDKTYYDYLKENWRQKYFTTQSKFASFQAFWDNTVHDGVLNIGLSSALSYNGTSPEGDITKVGNTDLEIAFYEPISIGNGTYAGNPWLMEMPDPVSRTSWGNYLAVPVNFDGIRSMVGYNDLEDGDLVEVAIGDKTIIVPVIQQFGQMAGTVALALGYGRPSAGNTGSNVGQDINDCLTRSGDTALYFNNTITVSNKKGKEKHFSCVQYHHTYGVQAEETETGNIINADEAALVTFDYFTGIKGFQGALTDRSIIYTTNVAELKDTVARVQDKRSHAQHLNEQQIYRGYDDNYALGHHWGMHIDLNACIGCGACTVACMAENNVPVVGKEEVSRHHEMTWLRIDRYFYGSIENPNTVYQPMMCQHCDNAPCENVCPVNATNHSSEGLNQMAYNRCIGTRYCANNCPYKVRRFNWLDYTKADLWPANQPRLQDEEVPFMADNLTRMVLNPDVTVRARGVIEKCSFCVQRIQEGKLTAKVEGRSLTDRDVKTACQTSCPTGAITFGDQNNPKGILAEKLESPLNYIVLEEINVRSSVNYSIKVNNRDINLEA